MYKLTKKIADIAYKGRENEDALFQEFNGDIYFTVDRFRIFRIPKEQFLLHYNMNLWNTYRKNEQLASMFINDSEYTVELQKAAAWKKDGRCLQDFVLTDDYQLLGVAPKDDRCRIKHIAVALLRGFTDRFTKYLQPDRINEAWKTPLFLEKDNYKYLMILPVVA